MIRFHISWRLVLYSVEWLMDCESGKISNYSKFYYY